MTIEIVNVLIENFDKLSDVEKLAVLIRMRVAIGQELADKIACLLTQTGIKYFLLHLISAEKVDRKFKLEAAWALINLAYGNNDEVMMLINDDDDKAQPNTLSVI